MQMLDISILWNHIVLSHSIYLYIYIHCNNKFLNELKKWPIKSRLDNACMPTCTYSYLVYATFFSFFFCFALFYATTQNTFSKRPNKLLEFVHENNTFHCSFSYQLLNKFCPKFSLNILVAYLYFFYFSSYFQIN